MLASLTYECQVAVRNGIVGFCESTLDRGIGRHTTLVVRPNRLGYGLHTFDLAVRHGAHAVVTCFRDLGGGSFSRKTFIDIASIQSSEHC